MRTLDRRQPAAKGIVAGLLFAAALLSNVAHACSDREYRGAFGWCYPKAGGVVGQGSEALKHGDINGFAKVVGDVAIAKTCPACAIFGQNVVSRQDRETISTIVGRGIIIFSAHNPIPALLLVDAANRATAVQLAPQQPPISSSSSPAPPRATKNYLVTTRAACLTADDNGKIVAGWVTAPVLTDVSNGQPSTFPDVDLQKGDIIHVNAEPCDDTTKAKLADNTQLMEGSFSYDYPYTQPGPPSQMKYFLIGQKVS